MTYLSKRPSPSIRKSVRVANKEMDTATLTALVLWKTLGSLATFFSMAVDQEESGGL